MKKVGKLLFMILMILIITSCKSNEGNDREEKDTVDLENHILELENEINDLVAENNLLKKKERKYQNDVNEIIRELEKQKVENQKLLAVNTRYDDLIEFMRYEHFEAYSFSGEIYKAPSTTSDRINFFPGTIFVIDNVYNEKGERWLLVESVFSSDESKKIGYLKYNQDLLKPIEQEYRVNNGLTFDGHYIGQSADALLNNVNDIKSFGKGEQSWHIIVNGSGYGIDPISWTIKSVYITSSEVLFDEQFKVGDNAEEVIEYYTDQYPIFYPWKTMDEKPNNWFTIDKCGDVLNIVYDTDLLTTDSVVKEFKIFNQYDMN